MNWQTRLVGTWVGTSLLLAGSLAPLPANDGDQALSPPWLQLLATLWPDVSTRSLPQNLYR